MQGGVTEQRGGGGGAWHGTFFELSRSARLKPTAGVDRLVDSCCGPTRAVAYCRHMWFSTCMQPQQTCKETRGLVKDGLPRLCSRQLEQPTDGA